MGLCLKGKTERHKKLTDLENEIFEWFLSNQNRYQSYFLFLFKRKANKIALKRKIVPVNGSSLLNPIPNDVTTASLFAEDWAMATARYSWKRLAMKEEKEFWINTILGIYSVP